MRTIRAILTVLLALPAADTGALTLKDGAQWPDGSIPVCWETPQRKHAQERDLIRKAVAWTWEKESAVRFSGWQACREDSPGIRIAFETKFPQTHGRGTELDGKPRGMILPSLWSLAALSINLKAPVHEFGHALGFGHEYARPDAPDLARCSPKLADGAPYVEDDAPLTGFDPDSIMVGCVVEATVRFSRGTPKLSAADIFGLISVYGSHPDNILDRDEPGDRFGSALALEDLDGDGVLDLAVSAPGEDDGEGAVYLFKGDAFSGFRPWKRADTVDLADDNIAWSGPGSAQHPSFPTAPDLTRVGPAAPFPDLSTGALADLTVLEHDLDGDDFPDLIVGAPSAASSGVVMVFRGRGPDQPAGDLRPWYWFGQAY